MSIYLPSGRRELNVKVVEAAFNQEKALVGAFSVIVQLRRLIVCSTRPDTAPDTGGYSLHLSAFDP